LVVFAAEAEASGRTYTLDADFDEGVLVNVHHDSPDNDQLQLSEESIILPFIWIPNQNCIAGMEVREIDLLIM